MFTLGMERNDLYDVRYRSAGIEIRTSNSMNMLLPRGARARTHHANHKSPLLACRTLPRIVICCAEWSRVNQTASVNSHRLPNPRHFSHRFLAACVRTRSLRAIEREGERKRAARRLVSYNQCVFHEHFFLILLTRGRSRQVRLVNRC